MPPAKHVTPSTATPLTETIADYGRRLYAASAYEEVAEALASVTQQVFGWDYCQVLYTEQGHELRPLLLQHCDTKKRRTNLPARDLHDTAAALAELKEQGARATSVGAATDLPLLLHDLPRGKYSALAAPLGRGIKHAGQVLLIRGAGEPYSEDDLALLQALAHFSGDAMLRVRVEAEPHAPRSVVEERNLLRTLVDSIPDYLYIKDLESRFVVSNAALARSVGQTSPDAVVGKRDTDFAPPELEAQYRSDEMNVMSTGQPLVEHGELVVEASGKRVWVTTTKVPLRDEKGRVIGVVGVGHNPQPLPKREQFRRGTAEETAKKAGVSVATVSRAFNRSPRVTEETRERIYAAAREVGYYPNAAARSLSKGRTDVVSVILPAAAVKDEYQTSILAGLQSAVHRCGFDVLFATAENTDEALAQLDAIIAGQKSGAIAIESQLLDDAELKQIADSPIPVVLMNHALPPGENAGRLVSVGFDIRNGMRQAVRHLVALGHTSFALIVAQRSLCDGRLQVEGFRTAVAEQGMSVAAENILEVVDDESGAAGQAAIQQLLGSSAAPPTALICGSDRLAAAAISGARAWGRDVPSALSVIGYGNASWGAFYSPAITTVAQRGEDLGTAAGQLLIAHARDNSRSPENVLLPTRLILRASTAPLR